LAVIRFEMAPTQHGTTFGEEFTSVGGEQIMIQPLRSAHRRTWLALALVLPTVLIVGLMARRPLPRPDSKINNSEARQTIRQLDDLWTKHKIHSVLLRDTSDPTSVQVVLETFGDLSVPDVLVYWSPQLSGSDSLPTNAVLLGALENSRPLHLRDSNPKGFLILYSRAHHSIVDAAPLESVL
jgi:hypothetical protein